MNGSKEVRREAISVVSTIGPGLRVIGDCISDGIIRIDGRVEGQIRAEKTVIVGKGAEIDASIAADVLEVYGTVVGDIRVNRGTTLHKTARVEGEIQTAGIVVEEGARFKGCIVIGPDEESSNSAKSPDSEKVDISSNV